MQELPVPGFARHPFVEVMRRYVVDYLICQNASVCAEIMEPDYVLHMGGTDLGPRDEAYVPAVVGQLKQFPGLGMTVHEIIFTEDRLAMRFSQHGASIRHSNRQAAWGGIGLYRWNGTRLTSNFAIEDYAGRRRQLSDGSIGADPDVIEAPAAAPWDSTMGVPDLDAEADIIDWVSKGSRTVEGDCVWFDDAAVAFRFAPAEALLDVHETIVDDVFSASGRVAFHVTQHGIYLGGLDVPESRIGRTATLYSVGVAHRDSDGRLHGRIIRERGALSRALT
jgi:SnoaL-like polyketide cyclase